MANEKPLFPPVYIHEPTAKHTHTAIMLHGRASSGIEFSDDLFSSKLSAANENLPSRFPGWRWVFPSSRVLWSSTFQKEMPAWFDAYSLTDITAKQDLQLDGIKESVEHLTGILDEEIERLGGVGENLVLAGISQGAAVGLWTLLCRSRSTSRIGGFVGASCWLPLAADVEIFLGENPRAAEKTSGATVETLEALSFVQRTMATTKASFVDCHGVDSLQSTPVLLGHGFDDAYVDVELGKQARDVLTKIGLVVQWREYVGAEEEGHWFKEPEQLDDIAEFLDTVGKSEKGSLGDQTRTN